MFADEGLHRHAVENLAWADAPPLWRRDLGKAVQQLKRESGKGLFVGGREAPAGEFVVQPRLAGHGPTLCAGLSKYVELKLVSRLEFGSGTVAMRYEPRR
jgi:hypothetical protein